MPSNKASATGPVDLPSDGHRLQVVTHPIDDDWQVSFSINSADGRKVISGLQIAPRGARVPSGGITAALLRRKLKVGIARQYLRVAQEEPAAQAVEAKRVGRPVTWPSIRYYLRVRDRYVALLRAGTENIPKKLALEFNCNRNTMRSIIRRARKDRMLFGPVIKVPVAGLAFGGHAPDVKIGEARKRPT